jgi:hypothetical protein
MCFDRIFPFGAAAKGYPQCASTRARPLFCHAYLPLLSNSIHARIFVVHGGSTIQLRSCAILVLLAALSAFGQTYTGSTFAGGGLPVNVPALSASVGPVNGVAIDSAGNVFMASATYGVLRLDARTGLLSLIAGNGIPGFSGDNGPATSAQLLNPQGIALDPNGNLYIVDTGKQSCSKGLKWDHHYRGREWDAVWLQR